MTVDERIAALRAAMARYGLDAYLVPSSDPHQSEYVAGHWKAREWLSGFTGSAGLLVVTADHAGLWTDSRYFLQAESELRGTVVTLQRQRVPHAPEHVAWLAEHLPAGGTVGCDGFLFSVGQLRYLEKQLGERKIKVHPDLDLIGEIWVGRPPLPAGPVFAFDDTYAGQRRAERLASIREEMRRAGARHLLLTTLDDIAWTLNLRGQDVPYNPVFISYLLLDTEGARLFIDPGKAPADIREALAADAVAIHPYAALEVALEELPPDEPVLIDLHTISVGLYRLLDGKERISGENIPRRLKAIKNETEIAHIRRAMVKDGVALTRLYRWLEATLPHRPVTEYEVARQLDEFRRARGDYFGESFAAIVGYNANGAIIHYRPDPETCATLRPEGLLLLDSGGQYRDGTTDITRTTALGPPTGEQRRHFTLVLKGHIALAMARFPAGAVGMQLDALARQFLWQDGLNYGHGTGHGVGFFLSVHEPPQGFASNASTSRGTTALEPGMFTSNEPGYYREGAYGIRIENLILCVPDENSRPEEPFRRFETLTLFPIDRGLIETGLLTPAERQWLNDYHRRVFAELAPHLDPEEVTWLEDKCREV